MNATVHEFPKAGLASGEPRGAGVAAAVPAASPAKPQDVARFVEVGLSRFARAGDDPLEQIKAAHFVLSNAVYLFRQPSRRLVRHERGGRSLRTLGGSVSERRTRCRVTSSLLAAVDSEVALLAAAMCYPEHCGDVLDRLTPEQFGDAVHGRIWGATCTLIRSGRTPEPPLVRDALGQDQGFDDWGGLRQLIELYDRAYVPGLKDHADAVADRASRRAIITLTQEIQAQAPDFAAGTAEDLLAQLEHGAAEIASSGATAENWKSAGQLVSGALERARHRKGVISYPVGLQEVDALLGGLNAGESTVLGAWTGMGKTIGALQIAKANASAGLGTCYFSLEMADDPMGLRMACDLAYDRHAARYMGVTTNPTMDQANKGMLNPAGWERLQEAEQIIHRWPLLMDTTPGLTMVQIEAKARRAHRRWARQGIKPGPIFIDHIGKVRPSVNRRGDRTSEMTDVSNDCGEMAKRLHVPVVPLAQLNRQVEMQGDDKRPQLSHLKQSGAIAEDARQVVFLYRPEYYYRPPFENEDIDDKIARESKLAKVKGHLYWIVAKNSNGPVGQALTFCEAACSAVRSW